MTSSTNPQAMSDELAAVLAHGAVPQPTTETAEFWEGAARHELTMPFCQACSRYFFYPRVTCRYCHSEDVVWRQVSGKGQLVSYVINHLPFPEFETTQPQVVAIVGLEEGVNLLSQIPIEDPTPENLKLGMPLEVTFVERGDVTLPFFVPAEI